MSQENIAAGLPQDSSTEPKKRGGGPRTPEGKRRSSLNATKFGIFSKITIAPAEELATYTAHCAAYVEALKPVGIIESDIVQQIADLRYRLKRCNAAEQSIFARGFEDHVDEISTGLPEVDTALAEGATFLEHIKFFELLSLYESRLQRAIERNTAQLEKLQSERKSAVKAEEEVTQVKKQPASELAAYAGSPAPAANEFVFSEPGAAPRSAPKPMPHIPQIPSERRIPPPNPHEKLTNSRSRTHHQLQICAETEKGSEQPPVSPSQAS